MTLRIAHGAMAAALKASAANVITTLYDGTGSAQDIVTGVEAELDWIKLRDTTSGHRLFDRQRGAAYRLESNSTEKSTYVPDELTQFNDDGFSLGTDSNVNLSGGQFVVWSFPKKAGVFTSVRFVTDGNPTQTISHDLGATVGAIIVKEGLNTSGSWPVYHKDIAGGDALYLNSANPVNVGSAKFSSVTGSSFTFSQSGLPAGTECIAYIFAHNPTKGIACGSFTTDGSGNASDEVIGFSPTWVLWKQDKVGTPWDMLDTARGWADGTNDPLLAANSSSQEVSANQDYGGPNETGFSIKNLGLSSQYFYVAAV